MLKFDGLDHCLGTITFASDMHKNAITRKLEEQLRQEEVSGHRPAVEELISVDQMNEAWEALGLGSTTWGALLRDESFANVSSQLGVDEKGLLFLSKTQIERRLKEGGMNLSQIKSVIDQLVETSGHTFYHLAVHDFCSNGACGFPSLTLFESQYNQSSSFRLLIFVQVQMGRAFRPGLIRPSASNCRSWHQREIRV